MGGREGEGRGKACHRMGPLMTEHRRQERRGGGTTLNSLLPGRVWRGWAGEVAGHAKKGDWDSASKGAQKKAGGRCICVWSCKEGKPQGLRLRAAPAAWARRLQFAAEGRRGVGEAGQRRSGGSPQPPVESGAPRTGGGAWREGGGFVRHVGAVQASA